MKWLYRVVRGYCDGCCRLGILVKAKNGQLLCGDCIDKAD